CVFRPNPATQSDLKRPPILVQTGHSFRFKAATDSGAKRPPIPVDPATLAGGLATRDNPA
ncbi:MAG: hypothetical protein AADX96_03055, partial [Thiocapsa sp. C3-sup]|uniref:hypothetical protein n=1 Tax=unclassified Thiocapsa TaxID=2641286 RepID=UPI0035B235EC